MKLERTILLPLGLFFALASSTSAKDVKTDYNRNANFERFRTYSWQTVRTQDPLWRDRIMVSVDSALAGKGWTRVESGGDIAVVAIEMTKNERTLNTFYNNLGGGWRWGGGFGTSTTTVDTYTVGTLVVDLFDASTKDIIWRGFATDTFSNNSDKNIKAVDRSVQKMFAHFPPEPRK